MTESLLAVGHGVDVGLPFGLLVGLLLTPVRLTGIDFRQWFRDPGQPSAWSDDSWIGLTCDAIKIVFFCAAIGLFIASIALAVGRGLSPANCCLLPDVWNAFHTAGPYLLGALLGVVVVQCAAEMTWRAGVAWVPDPATEVRYLSPVTMSTLPIAKPRSGRRLIVCCDGTWNWPDRRRETNVVRLVRLLACEHSRADGSVIPQISHYHLGVGTGNVVDRIFGGGIGIGLSASVKSCYGFLVDNYIEGDEIFLFGFSRGAYVARSVAGLVGCAGILQKQEMQYFIDVWDWYTEDRRRRDVQNLNKLAPDRHKTVDIEGIGVWDTVGALGIPGTRFCAKSFAFHETALGPGVRHAFQALAIDEQRGNFQAAVWTLNKHPRSGQVLEQAWFPGAHSNIGGGYEQHGLSDTTLLWMLSRILKWDLLELNMDAVAGGLDQSEPYPAGILAKSRTRFWRAIGSPVPRPVGITTDAEQIHESAWERAAKHDGALHADVYRHSRRKAWLDTMRGFAVARSDIERQYAVRKRGPRTSAARQESRKLGWCDRALRWLAGPS
ncbi:MAG: DUF2235 domain-containing protein [Casimicrobiaceae bacterium]